MEDLSYPIDCKDLSGKAAATITFLNADALSEEIELDRVDFETMLEEIRI